MDSTYTGVMETSGRPGIAADSCGSGSVRSWPNLARALHNLMTAKGVNRTRPRGKKGAVPFLGAA